MTVTHIPLFSFQILLITSINLIMRHIGTIIKTIVTALKTLNKGILMSMSRCPFRRVDTYFILWEINKYHGTIPTN